MRPTLRKLDASSACVINGDTSVTMDKGEKSRAFALMERAALWSRDGLGEKGGFWTNDALRRPVMAGGCGCWPI